MKKCIKMICFSLAIVLFSSCLYGCDNNNDLKNLKDDLKPTTAKLSPDSITLCFVGYGTNGQPRNLSTINEMLAELNKKTMQALSTEIKLQWLPYSSYDAELATLLESGSEPDAFMTMAYSVGQLHQKGLLKDITELFPKYAPRYFSLLEKSLGDEEKKIIEFDKKLYAVHSNDIYPPQSFVMARKDLADKYAPEGISSSEDYEKFMKKVKDNEERYVPGCVGAYNFLNAYMLGNGYFEQNTGFFCRWDAKDLTVRPAEDIDVFKTACRLYRQWKKDGLLLDTQGMGSSMFLADGIAASTLIRGAQVHSTNNLYMGSYEYNIYPLYLGQPYMRSMPPYSMVISEGSKKADRVLMFIEWLQSGQENYDLFMYGIKDTHYKLNGNKLDFSGIDQSGAIAQWWGSQAMKNYIYERPFRFEPDNYKEFLEKCNNNTFTYYEIFKKFGYDINNMSEEEKARQKSVSDEAMKYLTARNSVYNEFIKQWEAGDLSKTLEDMIKEKGANADTDKYIEIYSSEMKKLKK